MVATYHGDGVVEQRLPKYDDVQNLVDVDLLKHGQHSHGVHRRQQRREHKALEDAQPVGDPADVAGETEPPDAEADEEGVEEGAHHGEEQNGTW